MSEMTRRGMVGTGSLGLAGAILWSARVGAVPEAHYPLTLPDAEWKKRLPAAAYEVLRHEDTEQPFTSPLLKEHRAGRFACLGCGQQAFSSSTKFDSGTGWPSFWAPIKGAVATKSDSSIGMERTEVHCTRCGGHLGHVFDDGPKPTGLRYCMNGVAMRFIPGTA